MQPDDATSAPWSVELPRIAPTEPRKAQELFTVQPDVRLELVASEPLVVDPVAMAFDESGALFVVEMRGYSEQGDEHLGRVRRLTDRDGDGAFDHSTIFCDKLSWPTAVCCWDGGVYVAAAPDILLMRDRDDDGTADERDVIFTGLGRSNVQGLVNSFQWGLDNHIYAAVSSSGAKLRHVAAPAGGVLDLRGRDFLFDPRTHVAIPATGGGQHGMCFNRWGDRFVCSNSDHLQAIVFEDRYLQRNPYQAPPGPRRSIAADGPQAEVFRTSQVEPWRVVRTKMRLSGYAPGLIEGGGRASGYFTSATGVTIDEGGLGDEPVALVADVGSNLVHRKRLVADGVTYLGERIDRESEVIASSDNWFRPVQMCLGPEGAVYVADMYREVIEHPLALPPEIKQQLDLTSGRDRGRIYRIVPAGYEHQTPQPLHGATSAQLAAELEHPNMWRRTTAARLLYERQDASIVPLLQARLQESSDPVAKISLLYALAGMNSLEDRQLLVALEDAHAQVRRHALRLAENRFDSAPALFAAASELVDDPEPVVRFQLALSLGASGDARVAQLLVHLARNAEEADIVGAALVSAHSSAGPMVAASLKDEAWRATDAGREVVASLIAQIKRQQRPADLTVLTDLLSASDKPSLSSHAVEVLIALGPLAEGEGPAATGPDFAALAAAQRDALAAHLPVARAVLTSDRASRDDRTKAIRLLALGDLETSRSALVEQLAEDGPDELSSVVVAALGQRRSPLVAAIVMSAWERMTPQTQRSAAALLCSRDVWAAQLLEACERQQASFAELPDSCQTALCNSPREEIRQRAVRLRGASVPVDRQAAFQEYVDVLAQPGDAARGEAVFAKNCSTCHQVDGQGYAIGPSLAAMANRGAEALLYNILVPNAEIDPRYAAYTVLTADGLVLSGVVAAETASSVTLKGPEGEVSTVLRVDVEEMQNSGRSLMPEGLEKTIDKAAMADLLAYLRQSASGGKDAK